MNVGNLISGSSPSSKASLYMWKLLVPVLLKPATAAAKSRQLCPTLCDPIDGSPPGSPVPGILQPRTLEWVAISFSNAGKWKVKVKSLSHATPWTAAYQAPLPMGFSRQEYGIGLPLPSPIREAPYLSLSIFLFPLWFIFCPIDCLRECCLISTYLWIFLLPICYWFWSSLHYGWKRYFE